MKLFKRTTIYFDSEDENILAAFANDKLSSESQVEQLREVCANLLYAISNDSKSIISDVKPIAIKKGESNG